MFKVIGLGKRKEGTTHEECIRHWAEVHGLLARELPGLRKYVISDIGVGPEGQSTEWDGMAELWFDTADAYLFAMKSEAGLATREDSDYLSDRLMVYVGQEYELV